MKQRWASLSIEIKFKMFMCDVFFSGLCSLYKAPTYEECYLIRKVMQPCGYAVTQVNIFPFSHVIVYLKTKAMGNPWRIRINNIILYYKSPLWLFEKSLYHAKLPFWQMKRKYSREERIRSRAHRPTPLQFQTNDRMVLLSIRVIVVETMITVTWFFLVK